MNEFERVRRSILINPGEPSYAILTNGTRVDFELSNTPMSNFCNPLSTVVINGSTIQKTDIKELVFGDSYKNVTSINTLFLHSYPALTSLDLSVFSKVTSIGDTFLQGCSALTSLDLSAFSNVTKISNSFLYGCSALTSLDLSVFSNVTSIGNYFLRSCTSLTSVDLSGFVNVTSIGSFFMYQCSSLASIDLDKSTKIENIGTYFVNLCWNLNSLSIGTIIPPTLANGAFGNSPIQNIYVPSQSVNAYKTATNWNIHANKISAILDGYWVHKDTGVKTYFDLTDPSITNGVMSAPSWKFNCSEVKIPLGVTGLGQSCFYNCDALTSIKLPEGVTFLGAGSFSKCISLISITIPESVANIGEYCFNECSSLTSITIPEGVTALGYANFYKCSSLTLATVLPVTPPYLGATTFDDVHSSFNIKVHASYVNAYKTATNWINYADKISAI